MAISDNADRARYGLDAVAAVALRTGVAHDDPATAISDVLAYIAHACDALGLDPLELFKDGHWSYCDDREDGPFCYPMLADAKTFAIAHKRSMAVAVPDESD